MIRKSDFPILEYDDQPCAMIEPSDIARQIEGPCSDKLVICFFKEAINKLIEEGELEKYVTLSGENDLQVYKFKDSSVLLIHGIIGAPATAGFLDALIGWGVKKITFCGGGGALDKEVTVGKVMVVEGAIRDEGFSYHYAPPSRIIYTEKDTVDRICDHLEKRGVNYFKGITWTTDAIYRETKALVEYRREEGAKIVEMEQAGCIAVARYRKVKYGALIYGGDDLSGEVWDSRRWNERRGVRLGLIKLCKELVEII